MKIRLLLVMAITSLLAFTACTRRVAVVAPPARVEVVPAPPSARHVWVKGYYTRRGRNYVWVPGHYVVVRGRRY